MATFTGGRHFGKIIQRVLKINASTKNLVERLCDLKISALSLLGYIRSISAPDKATLKAEAHALQCTTTGPYNAIPTSLLGVGSVCGLGPDLVGIHSISLAARCRTAACTNTLSQSFEKIHAAREYDFAPVLTLSSIWDKEFLAPSMARSTAEAFNMVCCLDRNGKLDDSPLDKKQKVATTLLRDELYRQDFAGPISSRASRVLGPISRFRVVEILPHMKLVSRASHPGLTVGFLRILCNGLCTAQSFHTGGEEQTCRVRCPDEPDSLRHYNECLPLYNLFASLWGHAPALPRRSHLLHDLITQVFLRSLQYGIPVVGFMDAFVHAHHQHRRSIENPGNSGDCMKRKNTLHDGYHSCLRSRISGNMSNKTNACSPASQLPPAETQSQVSASPQRSCHNTRKRQWLPWMNHLYWRRYSRCGWWNISRMWCHRTISRWRMDIMFGPVIITEARLAF